MVWAGEVAWLRKVLTLHSAQNRDWPFPEWELAGKGRVPSPEASDHSPSTSRVPEVSGGAEMAGEMIVWLFYG